MLAFFVSLMIIGGAPGPTRPDGPTRPATLPHPALADVPRLKTTTPRHAQAAWMAVKGLTGTKRQLEVVARDALTAESCVGLVDLKALVQRGVLGPGFVFRDNVRGRSWARPTMALLLGETMKAFRKEYPSTLIAIGDVSQPGCGQLAHGVLVQTVEGKEALALLDAADRDLDKVATVDITTAKEFPWEPDRFTSPDQRVRVAREVLGWSRAEDEGLVLRVGRTRHAELPSATPAELQAFQAEVQRLAKGALVARKKLTRADGSVRVVSQWVDEAAKRQLILLSDTVPRGRIDFAEVREARLATWQDDKPGSRPDEVLWARGHELVAAPAAAPAKKKGKAQPVARAAAQFAWTRWQMLYEAGHLSHLSGIDADLSYATIENKSHFAVDFEAMDVPATFRWFELLDETARALGTPVDKILVDPDVLKTLKKKLPMKGKDSKAKSRAWRLLALVGGHDAHHHLRIVEASDADETKAKKRLE